MDQVIAFINSLVPAGFDWAALLKSAAILAAAVFVLGILARLLFGKNSLLNRSLSSAISILFIYIVTVVIHSLGVDLSFLISPLPFVTITGDYLSISVDMSTLSTHLLSMVILSFLANLADSWLPTGKGIFSWFFFRCISVLLAMLLHLIAISIISVILPAIILLWTPRILLWALVIMILLGALKVLFAVTNPLFAFLYSFFFGHQIGKMVYRAVLTTAILAGIVYGLNYFGISTVYIASSALAAYAPVLVVLLVIWYVIGHFL